MTIIAAIRENDDAILIGADSGSTEFTSGFRRTVDNKLQKHPTSPIAWGVAGSPYLGINLFSKYLQCLDPPKTWGELIQSSRSSLSDIIRTEVEFAERAYTKPSQTVEILLAGWIDGKPGILTLTHDAPPDFEESGFFTIGQEKNAMYLGHKILEDMQIPNLEKFSLLIRSGAESLSFCAPPVHIWRITKNGIETIL